LAARLPHLLNGFTYQISLIDIPMAIIRYLINDTAESVAFYTEKLGFKLQNNLGPFAIIAKDDLTLWLADPRTSAAQRMYGARVENLR